MTAFWFHGHIMVIDSQMETEVHLIERWLHGTTEPFDDWD